MSHKKGKRGQMLTLSEKNVVLDVLEQLQKTLCKSRAVEACSKATGRSPRMIYKLAKEKEMGTLKPPKRFKMPHVKSHMRIMKYKSDVRSCIRRIVHSCFVQQIPPQLSIILETFNAVNLFPPFKKCTLYNLLKDIGFEYERRGGKGVFVEARDIVNYRHNYLQRIKDIREMKRPIIYTGELWLDMSNMWENIKVEESVEQKSSSVISPVVVLVHAGYNQGFINGAEFSLQCKTDRTDLREALDSETYEKWFFNQLLPNCPKHACIVMDNVKYNSRKVGNVPNHSWSKEDIVEWLENVGIEAGPTLSVSELIELVNSVKDDHDSFKIDTECEQLGFEVLRLPSHHRELNPIYMVWDQIEDHIKRTAVLSLKKDVSRLIEEAYLKVTSENWLSYVTEVESNEKFLWQADLLQDNVDSLIGKLKWSRSLARQV